MATKTAPKRTPRKAAKPRSKARPARTPAKVAARAPRKAAPTTTRKAAPKARPASAPKTAVPPSAPPVAVPARSMEAQARAFAHMKAFFDRTCAVLDESDSDFAPTPAMFTTAQQVAHAAQTVDWFLEGAFAPSGFKMDFAGMEAEVRKVTSLGAARAWLEVACQRFANALQERPAADWHQPIVKDTLMGGAPRWSVVDGLVDHTAHHRGALAVYARLRGKTPAMPYM